MLRPKPMATLNICLAEFHTKSTCHETDNLIVSVLSLFHWDAEEAKAIPPRVLFLCIPLPPKLRNLLLLLNETVLQLADPFHLVVTTMLKLKDPCLLLANTLLQTPAAVVRVLLIFKFSHLKTIKHLYRTFRAT